MPLSLADVLLAQQAGGAFGTQTPQEEAVTPATVLTGVGQVGRGVAQADVGLTEGVKRFLSSVATLPGDVWSGRTAADLSNPEYVDRARDLAMLMIGTPGGAGGVGSGARGALEEAPSFTERMAQGKDIAMERANRGQATGDYGLGTARRVEPDAPKGTPESASDRLMSSLRDTQRQLSEYKNPPAQPLLAPGEMAQDLTLFSGGNKKAGALLAAEKTAAGDQFVLPGAEKATDATMAQRASDAPLKPTVAQKPADFGLFGDESKQGTLFSGGNTRAGKLLAAGQGIRAYHGSPYDFEKFDISKIGTGEGAQSYGHGLYFAENPAVAADYKKRLTQHSGAVELETPYRAAMLDDSPNTYERFFAARLRENKGDLQATLQHLQTDLAKNPGDATIQKAIDFANTPDARFSIRDFNPGKMYEVNINAEPGQFLQWDKPLSQQPTAIQELVAGGPSRWSGNDIRGGQLSAPTGEDIYRRLATPELGPDHPGRYYTPNAATNRLNEAGIPGIRYLDQGSRAALQKQFPRSYTALGLPLEPEVKTSNYVVFNPEIVDILKKYGLAGLTMGGVLTAAGQEPAPTQ